MKEIHDLIQKTEELLHLAIEERQSFHESCSLPDGTIEHQHDREELARMDARIESTRRCVGKAMQLRDPPKAAPIPDEGIAKAADIAAEQELPNPKDALAYLIHRIEPGKNIHSANNVERAIASLRQALRAPRVPDGWMLFPVEAWDFLRGAGALDGHWYGDHRRGKPPFWWRPEIEKMLTAAQAPAESEFLEIPKSLRRLSNFEEHGQQVIDERRERVKVLEVALIEVAHSTAVSMPDELRHHIDRLISTDRLREGGGQ